MANEFLIGVGIAWIANKKQGRAPSSAVRGALGAVPCFAAVHTIYTMVKPQVYNYSVNGDLSMISKEHNKYMIIIVWLWWYNWYRTVDQLLFEYDPLFCTQIFA